MHKKVIITVAFEDPCGIITVKFKTLFCTYFIFDRTHACMYVHTYVHPYTPTNRADQVFITRLILVNVVVIAVIF
jgi:hypothetical protein